MGKKAKFMIELLCEDGEWHVWWPRDTDDRDRTKLGLKDSAARRWVQELVRPVTGYENLGRLHHAQLCSQIRGHGLDPAEVRIIPFRKGTWSRYEE